MFGRKLAPPANLRIADATKDVLTLRHPNGQHVPLMRAHLKPADFADLKLRMPESEHARLQHFADGGEIKPTLTLVSETPEVLTVQDESGETTPLVKGALSGEEMETVRAHTGEAQHLAEGGPVSSTDPYATPPASTSDLPPTGGDQSRPLSALEQQYQQYTSGVSSGITPLSFQEFAGMLGNAPGTEAAQHAAAQQELIGPLGTAAQIEATGGEASSGTPINYDTAPTDPALGNYAPYATPKDKAIADYEAEIRKATTVGAPKLQTGGGAPGLGGLESQLASSTAQSVRAVEAGGAAAQEEHRLEGAKLAAQAIAQAKQNEDMAEFTRTAAAADAARQAHTQEMMNDIDAFKIDPSRRWNSIGAGNQALASFAMILGGIGQGLARGGPNYAMQVIDKAIDRDIDAQKENLQTKNTLLGRYLQQTESIRAATAFTKADKYTQNAAELTQIATKSNSQIERQRGYEAAAQWSAKAAQLNREGVLDVARLRVEKSNLATAAMQRQELGQKIDMNKLSIAQQRALLESVQRGTAAGDEWAMERAQAQFNPKQHLRDTVTAGYDPTGLPIHRTVKRYLLPNVEPKDAVAAFEGARDQDTKLSALERFVTKHPFGGIGWAQGAEGQALAKDLALSFNKLQEGNNKLNHTELDMIDQLIGNPTSFFQGATGQEEAVMRVLRHAADAKRQGVLETYTIPDAPNAR